MRKIASNYIFLPDCPLIKNGYVVCGENGTVKVVDTGGVMKEIQGLEFYGGLIVADYVREYMTLLRESDHLLNVLEKLYVEKGGVFQRIAIIEGADLLKFVWREGASIRMI